MPLSLASLGSPAAAAAAAASRLCSVPPSPLSRLLVLSRQRVASSTHSISSSLASSSSASSPSSSSSSTKRNSVRAMATSNDPAAGGEKLDKNTPDAKWKEILNAEQYYILRQSGTEPAGSGEYNKFYPKKGEGAFYCAGCGAKLYEAETKFDSGCGWPAFYDNVDGAITRIEDNSMGMRRVEIRCSNCGGHQGHVFSGEGFPTPTNERHCVNSRSIVFKEKAEGK